MEMESLEEAVNEITDKDWNWWPFLWLRPSQHERLSTRLLATLALLYGLPIAGLASVALSIIKPEARELAPWIVALVPLAFFFVASVVVGPMWNRRAERLSAKR